MGGKNRSKKKGSVAKKNSEAKKLKVTMEAIQAMSDSDDSSGLPPEEEWDENTRRLKAAIESGAFEGDDESFEDVELGEDDDDDDEPDSKGKPTSKSKQSKNLAAEDNDEEQESESNDSDTDDSKVKAEDMPEESEEMDEDELNDNKDNSDDEDDDANQGPDDDEEIPENTDNLSIRQLNAMRQKSLKAVADSILNKHLKMTWPESFDIVSFDPLPFGDKKDSDEEETGAEVIDINDDLKREVTFYNVALEAVLEGRRKCEKSNIPFSRPESFFAEMVKTDDHMAKVKDRLIFENKKMEAVAQRKSNKEQKLRAKESHANKLAEKARRKKENLKAVDDYAKAAASRRGGGGLDDDSPFEPNKRRMAANKKYGFGGKRGRFKQTDSSKLNDMSSFNPRGNFSGGQKRKGAAAGGKRPGKRARDAARSRN